MRTLGRALALALVVSVPATVAAAPGGVLAALREQAKLTGIGDAVGDRSRYFGSAMAADGDTLVVGAPESLGAPDEEARAYVFVRIDDAWTLQAELRHPGMAGPGISVGISGDIVVLGSWQGGKAVVFVRSSGAWTEEAVLTSPNGEWFGSSVSVSGETLVVGAPGESASTLTQSGAAYVYLRSGGAWTLQQKLVPAGLASQDYFGTSVSVSGDEVVVGAPGDDTAGGVDAGSAHAFARSGTVWTEEAALTSTTPASYGNFGSSVALAGASLLVGAPYEKVAGFVQAGAAYPFVRSGASWRVQRRLVPAVPAAGLFFGIAVALTADTAVVGAPGDGTAIALAGSALVFVRSGGAWTAQQRLAASVPELEAQLGRTVAVTGDLALVGAPWRDQYSGSVFPFHRTGEEWTEEARLDAPGTTSRDAFGSSVALEDDILVAGAPGDDVPGGRGAGSAYVFVRAGAVWSLQQKIGAADPRPGAHFGATVVLSGDTLAVGAPDANDFQTGSVYVFVRVRGVWQQQTRIALPAEHDYNGFGQSIALDADTLLVGAPYEANDDHQAAGVAYVFTRSGASWTLQQRLVVSPFESFADAGYAVALRGDTAFVGVPGQAAGGKVAVFERTGGLWTEAAALSALDAAPGSRFGQALGISGDTAVVGAPETHGAGIVPAGAAYVFVRTGSAWALQAKLVDGAPSLAQRLGGAIGVSGDTALVGPALDALAPGGAVLLFGREGGSWSQRQRSPASDSVAGDGFGSAVALSSAAVAVGAPMADAPARDSGAVYVLVPATADLATTIGGSPTSVVQGDLVTYTVVVSNNGPDTAPAVGLLTTLTPGLAVSSAGSSQGVCTRSASGAGCDLGSLSAGASATVTVVAVAGSVGTQTSQASIVWSGSDPVPGNETSSASTTVNPGATADVSVTKTSEFFMAEVGLPAYYQIKVQNLGPGTAVGVVVDDPTPPGVTLQDLHELYGGCAGAFPCTFPRLLPGEERILSATYDIPASYPGPDPIVNTANVTSLTDDPNASNDQSSVVVPFFVPAVSVGYHTVTPCRLLDTRTSSQGPIAAGTVRKLWPWLVDPCRVPIWVVAVAVNVTVTQPTAAGNVRLYPAGIPVPQVSMVNYAAGQTRGSNGIVALSRDQSLAIRVAQPSGTVHVIVDVFGYFE